MSIVQTMLNYLETSNNQPATVVRDGYSLQLATGRTGSVCFLLHQSTMAGPALPLAEGFSHNDHLVYDYRSVSETLIEDIINNLLSTSVPISNPVFSAEASSPAAF